MIQEKKHPDMVALLTRLTSPSTAPVPMHSSLSIRSCMHMCVQCSDFIGHALVLWV
jgi:hypothetical protein